MYQVKGRKKFNTAERDVLKYKTSCCLGQQIFVCFKLSIDFYDFIAIPSISVIRHNTNRCGGLFENRLTHYVSRLKDLVLWNVDPVFLKEKKTNFAT